MLDHFKCAIGAHYRSHSTWDPRRHLYEELRSRRGSNETVHTHRGKILSLTEWFVKSFRASGTN
jgi:hypothetical protein